jgi:3-oxoacyl-[acyl-carrier protein] reductase
LVEDLLRQGHSVWGLARSDQSELSRTFAPTFRCSKVDVSDWEQVAAAAQEVAQAWPHVDALIACAGLQGAIGPAVSVDPLHWSATVRANLDGTFYAIRAFYMQLEQCGRRAKIVCFSGGGATKPRSHFSAYSVAKTGVVRLVETLAEEWSGQPIDINAVAPGAINTRLTEEVLALGPAVAGEAEYNAALKQKSSGGGSLEKALGLVNFLLSPKSDGITGRLISAPWDPWPTLGEHAERLKNSDVYTLRRIVPPERNLNFG